MKPATIRDLVDLRPHPTVVRLDDLRAEQAGWISESYCLTREVENHLNVLKEMLRKPAGSGVFLIGPYGSGKSHFLAYLTQQIISRRFTEDPPEAVAISLLNYSSDTRIEDIVGGALAIGVGHDDRRVAWAVSQARRPVLLLVDEVSEFLRSKPTREGFNEDIRFLQFMGEWAQGNRFWLVAAMQEQIEHTGDIEYDLYRKIKDRFPVRLILTPAHVKDLVSQSILVKKPGYNEAVDALVERLRKAMPADYGIDLDQLRAIYPLHPATLDMLAEIRDRFSQARGVVDFVTTQLGGNPSRHAAPLLDEPWGTLLTPDFIVDHFQDLFEIQPEFLPLAQCVFPFYRAHMDDLFATGAQRDLAWRVLKLLVLVHLSPSRDAISPAEAAAWLLYAVTRVDPGRNIKIIENILQALGERGRYLTSQAGRFRLDLADRGEEDLEKALRRESAELHGQTAVAFETIVPLLGDTGFNPLVLPRDRWQPRGLRWHFHERLFHVYFGDDQPPSQQGPALCIRTPWGEGGAAMGCYTLVPSRIEMTEDLLDLAALARLRSRQLSPAAAARVDRRISERLPLFAGRLRNAYLDAAVVNASGAPETPPRQPASVALGPWLENLGHWLLRRLYPGFERFAPGYGPLPNEAYRIFMRWATQRDLGEYEADEYVKLIREAYLVPMGLMQRKGRDYVHASRLDRHDLVALLTPLLEHHPSPQVVYDHLSNPVYGLVPDQIHLLLVFLLLKGEIDILKEGRSYRELFEALPTPVQYDRIAPGRALTAEQLKDLERLCERFGVRLPKQWTVASQQHAVQGLREIARRESARLQAVVLKLERAPRATALAEKLQQMWTCWNALEAGSGELQGFQQFLHDVRSVGRFLAMYEEVRNMPDRVERILAEITRYGHLFGHPALKAATGLQLQAQAEALGEPPDLVQLDEVDLWLAKARAAYEEHKTAYAQLHQAWWSRDRAIWQWQPPKIAASRQLGLDEELRKLADCRRRAETVRCRGLVNLDYQPLCPCGFDGGSAPIVEELRTFETLRDNLDTSLGLFFGQEAVKARIRKEWIEVNPRTMDYLEGRAPYPEIGNLALFEQLMSGAGLVKELDIAALVERIQGGPWERPELVAAIDAELSRYEPARIRIRAAEAAGIDEIALWCAEQSLRHSVALPKGLASGALRRTGGKLRREWVSTGALSNLETLGFDEETEDQILRWLLDGELGPPPVKPLSDLVAAAVETMRPSAVETAERLGILASGLYRHHQRMWRIAPRQWLDRLDALAQTELRSHLPSLPEAVREHADCQWIIVDCLGVPLFAMLRGSIEEAFANWQLDTAIYAMVSPRTTTDACYRDLIAAGHVRAYTKIDAVDQLIHSRFPPFDDLARLAAAEIRLACNGMQRRLDRTEPLLLFADHGFRISRDGKSYGHGGPSTLERLVPVVRFTPR